MTTQKQGGHDILNSPLQSLLDSVKLARHFQKQPHSTFRIVITRAIPEFVSFAPASPHPQPISKATKPKSENGLKLSPKLAYRGPRFFMSQFIAVQCHIRQVPLFRPRYRVTSIS